MDFAYWLQQHVLMIENKLLALEANQKQMLRYLSTLQTGEVQMSAQLEALKAQVAKNAQVEASAVVLIQGIAAQLAANASDPVQVKEMADQLAASADALAAAITANTPAAPVP